MVQEESQMNGIASENLSNFSYILQVKEILFAETMHLTEPQTAS